MALLDAVLPGRKPGLVPLPKDTKERLDRGRQVMLRQAPQRRLCMRFERGETYWWLDEKNKLRAQDTVTHVTGGGKPPHRVRNKYNYLRPIVEAKISAATQRVPGYEVTPATTDPEDVAAARLSERVAIYGYDKWRVRQAALKTVKLAIACGGSGYALPYFDPNVGPYVQMEDGSFVGYGEVKIIVASGNEVFWEAGVDFVESPWWALERARTVDDVKAMPGYLGGELNADASTSDIPSDTKADQAKLVLVTEVFERPCPKYPQGRHFHIANGRIIAGLDPLTGQYDPYPLRDAKGRVVDEPILHRLVYTVDPDRDDDLGLVWQLIDFQRTAQDCWNKLLEWKNRCLNPQMRSPVGALLTRPDDTPGAIREYSPNKLGPNGQPPEWERAPVIPAELFRILEQAVGDMRAVAGDQLVEAQPDIAAKMVNAVIEQGQQRWQSFLGDLAEWHSRLMRHCLMLVARHYTEPRLLTINGRTGPYLVPDFRGAQLLDQVDVRVLPGSLEARSRQQVQQTALMFADRGWISPTEAMTTIEGGTAEKLTESYELDVARVNRVIQKIRDGSVLDMPATTGVDPMTGEITNELPGWMPRQVDRLEVWKQILADWMKTEDYDGLPAQMQEVANLIYAGILKLEAQQQQAQLDAQNASAEQAGMRNAAKPQTPKPMPDMPMPGTDSTGGTPPA